MNHGVAMSSAVSRVFLSYENKDKSVAKAISAELAKRGLFVWPPEEELLPGDNLHKEIGKALEKSNVMVVLVSPESMRSDQVLSEINFALGCENYAGRIFPVEVRPTGKDNVPWILQKFRSFKATQSAAKIAESIAEAVKQVA